MDEKFESLLKLPHGPGEVPWMKDRLETLSVREAYILTAAILRLKPETAAEVINVMANLDMYDVYWPASGYDQLGEWYLYEQHTQLSEEAKEHTDMAALGELFEDKHPGLFIGDCYVTYPLQPEPRPYKGMGFAQCEDTGCSVRLRLASVSHPDGVWVRLPDHENMFGEKSGKPDEIALALRELGVESIHNCTLLDARCGVLLPTVNLAEQYDSIDELIADGNALGYLIEAAGAEMSGFVSWVRARTEFGGRQTLKAALEVAQKMNEVEPCARCVVQQDESAAPIERLDTNEQRDEFLRLPHTEAEEAWIKGRFATMSAKESIILTAAMRQRKPESMIDTINLLLDLDSYTIYAPGGSYEALARFYLDSNMVCLPDTVMKHTDLEKLGKLFVESNPGIFIGDYYVANTWRPRCQLYTGENLADFQDNHFIKLKLASRSCPEGVWLSLPEYIEPNFGWPDEVGIALKMLNVEEPSECIILDAVCSLPEAGNLMEQYANAAELIHDGQELGEMISSEGRGMQDFGPRLAAAISFEDCQSLKSVLEVAKNLKYYDFMPISELSTFAIEELRTQHVPARLIDTGAINLADYADSLLRDRGYAQMENGMYIRQGENHPWQRQEQSQPAMGGMEMA